MFEDPQILTSSDWNNIHIWIQLLSYYGLVIVLFVIAMLVAHAFIPSMITTGHIPPRANGLRLPLTLVALLFLAAALALLALDILAALEIADFYDRWLI